MKRGANGPRQGHTSINCSAALTTHSELMNKMKMIIVLFNMVMNTTAAALALPLQRFHHGHLGRHGHRHSSPPSPPPPPPTPAQPQCGCCELSAGASPGVLAGSRSRRVDDDGAGQLRHFTVRPVELQRFPHRRRSASSNAAQPMLPRPGAVPGRRNGGGGRRQDPAVHVPAHHWRGTECNAAQAS